MNSTSDSRMDLTSKIPSFEAFDSTSAAEEAVQAWARESGFAATTKTSDNGSIHLHCDRSLNPLLGCEFLASISSKEKVAIISEQEQVLQEWHVNILNATHTHGPSPVKDHKVERQIDKSAFMHLFVDHHIREGRLTRYILETLHTPDVPGGEHIQAKDIKNRRAYLRRTQKHRELQDASIEALIWKQKILGELNEISRSERKRQRRNERLMD